MLLAFSELQWEEEKEEFKTVHQQILYCIIYTWNVKISTIY